MLCSMLMHKGKMSSCSKVGTERSLKQLLRIHCSPLSVDSVHPENCSHQHEGPGDVVQDLVLDTSLLVNPLPVVNSVGLLGLLQLPISCWYRTLCPIASQLSGTHQDGRAAKS